MIDKIEESFDKDNNGNDKRGDETLALIEAIDNDLRETYQYFRDSIYSIFEEIPRNLANKKIIINPLKVEGDCYKIFLYWDWIELSLVNKEKNLFWKLKSENEIYKCVINEIWDSLISKNNQHTGELKESSVYWEFTTIRILKDVIRFVSKNKEKYSLSEELQENY